ncbi:MAG TPA: PPK2 family polyphosphate kinase [Nitriliruptoraceae bacterium]|nr:PPK2 family polyphosphate kinase [Nitriliruptoraceae bacterium]
MTIDVDALRVRLGQVPELGVRARTRATAGLSDKEDGKALLADLQPRIADLQDDLWAENARSLLVVLQGMDTAGKSTTSGRVFRLVHPQGISVSAFKKPSERELDHDYLWRVHARVPSRGTIGIFDRSHYEDVGVVAVNGWIDDATVHQRHGHINDFERMLADTGTVIRKIWLDISPQEQRKELQERIDEPDKHWKFNTGDLDTRAQWDDYMRVYGNALAATSTDWAPWYRVPGDRRWVSSACVAQIVADALEEMAPANPGANPDFSGLVVPAHPPAAARD